jgi:hypothetical protein
VVKIDDNTANRFAKADKLVKFREKLLKNAIDIIIRLFEVQIRGT